MERNRIYEQIGVAMTCRSFEEYVAMFQLTEKELSFGRILDVAAGGSSFVATASAKGYDAQAVDPRYSGDVSSWTEEAAAEIVTSTSKLEGLTDRFDWSYYGSLARHKAGREASLGLFRADLESNRKNGTLASDRYIAGSLPTLPLETERYGLVLCSHFLFLYAEQFGFDFHVQAIQELLRVCRQGGEVRIYPLLSLRWEPYPRFNELIDAIESDGKVKATIRTSGLPFIPGSEHYLHIQKYS
ncbi:methylase [Paenibacillus sp. strain BS8-2]